MKKVFILYSSFYDYDGKELTIGGIQTYIRNLCHMIIERSEKPIILQYANRDFTSELNGIDIYGVKTNHLRSSEKKTRTLYEFTKTLDINESDLIIFATDNMNISCNHKNVISIQHGVCWDIPLRGRMNRILPHLDVYLKARFARNQVIKVEKVKYLVCVDYNFINWYRSQVSIPMNNYYVIPNSVNTPPDFKKEFSSECNILFARRFEVYRGTELIIEIIKKLNNQNIKFNIDLAGTGSEKAKLVSELRNYDNVKIISYEVENSIEIHKKYDIALIPTIGSEGTSLSMLEAMAAKCNVIASNVGGMTNVILNNFNGFLVNPDADSFVNKIIYLINNKEDAIRMRENAYHTVKQSFDNINWKIEWNKVLDIVEKNESDSGIQ